MSLTHDDYTIGWICALPRELAAAEGMLDEYHPSLPQDVADSNVYTLGRIGTHNVVLACLPAGEVGVVPAATIVTRMKGTFRRLQLGLLVGVGGGAPSEKHDIRLGDVVVGDCGVIQYDMGKKVQGGHFLCTKEARRPSQAVLLVVSKLQARHMLGKKTIMHHIDQMTSRYTNFSHPGVQFDILYRSDYDHPDGADSCDQCEINQKVNRKPRSSVQPVVHYGLIASGNLVMRHGGTREQLQKQHNILCFEMEAAGVMDVFPCLVIRGICDYSDSHKNKKWQDYAAVTAAAYAKELLSIMHEPMPVQPVKLLHKDACFMVPFQQTSRFVGREDILAMIDEKLDAKQPAVLAGIGGVGKTQLAVRYCSKFREKHPKANVFWVNASTIEKFDQGYREIAKLLCIPGHEDPEFDFRSEICKRLSDNDCGQWLMVLDSLDDRQMLALQTEFIPSPSRTAGSIIVTTRDMRVRQYLRDWDHMAEDPIIVAPLSPQDASDLLKLALSADQRRSEDDLQELLELLGYLPLAITQAVAFIKQNRTTVTKYKGLLQNSQSVVHWLRTAEYQDAHRYKEARGSVYRTWEISFKQIRTQDPEAARLLSWMSMFDAQLGVPEWFFCTGDWDELELTTALGTLKSFSLITEGPGESFSTHRMIQNAVHIFLDQFDEREENQNKALTFLASKFPDPKGECWEDCDTLTPHAEEVLRYVFKNDNSRECTILDRAMLLHNLAAYKNMRGQYQSAYTQAQEAHTIRQKKLGKASLESLASLELVALVLVNQGEYKPAEEKQQTVLTTRQHLEEKDELLLLESKKLLADVLLKLGRYDDAANTYKEVLKESIEFVGDRHRNSLELMDRLGEVLEQQKRFADAEQMYCNALIGKQATLGEEHKETVKTKIFLYLLLASRSDYRRAQQLYHEALYRSTRSFGEKHPDTIRLLCNIASLEAAQKNWAEAEKVQFQAEQTFIEILGNNHPSTLICQSNLAVFKQEQGQYAEAEKLHRTLLVRRGTALGQQHPHTLTSMYHLAEVLLELEKYDEARKLLENVLSGRRHTLGQSHPDTLRCMSSLAGALDELRQFEDAECIYRKCLELKMEALGRNHPETLVDMNNLAEVLRQQDKFTEAESLHREVLQLQNGKTENSFLSKANLARVLYQQGKYDEAIDLYQQALQMVEETLGNQSHPARILSERLEVVLREKQPTQTVQKVFHDWISWLTRGYW